MPTITLAQPWKYCTPLATIDFPAGEHEVGDTIAGAALMQAPAALIEVEYPAPDTEEKADGDRIAKARAPRRSRTLES